MKTLDLLRPVLASILPVLLTLACDDGNDDDADTDDTAVGDDEGEGEGVSGDTASGSGSGDADDTTGDGGDTESDDTDEDGADDGGGSEGPFSALLDGSPVSSMMPLALKGGEYLTVSAIIGTPGATSGIVMGFPLEAGTFDCMTFPLQDPNDAYVTFQAVPPDVLNPADAMNGSCSLTVDAATESSASGTFEATVGNGTDPDYVITNGVFDLTFD